MLDNEQNGRVSEALMENTPHRLPINHMVIVAAKHCGFTVAEIRGPNRAHRYMPARFSVALVASELGFSLNVIARGLGRADHSTALHARDRGRYYYTRDQAMTALIDELRALAEAYSRRGRAAWADWLAGWDNSQVPVEDPVPAEIAEQFTRAEPIEPEEGDDEDADAFAPFPRPNAKTVSRMVASSVAYMEAVRREHPERCLA